MPSQMKLCVAYVSWRFSSQAAYASDGFFAKGFLVVSLENQPSQDKLRPLSCLLPSHLPRTKPRKHSRLMSGNNKRLR